MKLSLSTNWCNRRIEDGREIAEKALELAGRAETEAAKLLLIQGAVMGFARGGEPTPFLPASYLWRHPDYHLIYTTDKIAIESE